MLVADVHDCLLRQERCSLVLSGGKTPEKVVPRIAYSGLEWDRVDVTLSDERCVPVTHPASNEKMVRRVLQGTPAESARLIGLRGEGSSDVARVADTAERTLRESFSGRFDVVFLGMGPDGHIASLFPNGDWVSRAGTEWIVREYRDYGGVRRVSMSPERLLSANRIHMLVAGKEKLARIAEACEGARPDLLPVALLFEAVRPEIVVHIVREG
jgi:6-phosphogluconolactonase